VAIQNIGSILIGLVREGQDTSSALAFGLSLAGQSGAHASVEALSLKLTVTHALVSETAAGLVAAENARTRGIAQAQTERARQDALAAGIACTTEAPQLPYQDLSSAFIAMARVHGLTVVDAESDPFSLARALVEDVLFYSARPVVVVPPEHPACTLKRILVAWDGSAQAVRALNDALPLLRAAESVELVSVVGEKDLSRTVAGAEVAPHLVRHGVPVTVKDLRAPDGDVADALRNQAGLFRADLIVMGAFAHSRLRQLVLGGVTRSMLERCPAPLLLSH
jgi:nucleotide-binding universal stress UspA family protein